MIAYSFLILWQVDAFLILKAIWVYIIISNVPFSYYEVWNNILFKRNSEIIDIVCIYEYDLRKIDNSLFLHRVRAPKSFEHLRPRVSTSNGSYDMFYLHFYIILCDFVPAKEITIVYFIYTSRCTPVKLEPVSF